MKFGVTYTKLWHIFTWRHFDQTPLQVQVRFKMEKNSKLKKNHPSGLNWRMRGKFHIALCGESRHTKHVVRILLPRSALTLGQLSFLFSHCTIMVTTNENLTPESMEQKIISQIEVRIRYFPETITYLPVLVLLWRHQLETRQVYQTSPESKWWM